MVLKRCLSLIVLAMLQVSGLVMAQTQEAAAPVADPPQPVRNVDKPADRKFPILEYQVEGNTLLPATEIEIAVTPFLGPGRSIKDVEAARRELEKRYHDRGLQTVLVNIPPQEVGSGVVRLAVVEASVARLEIKGSRYHSLDTIRETVPDLSPGVTPDFKQVQKELAAVNHGADMRVTPVLRASTTPGHVDVDLNVQDSLPLHATLELNNRYSANTARLRLAGEISYDNLFQSGQSASLQYQTAPQHTEDAKIWSLSYVVPLSGGPVLAMYAVRSDSNIAAVGSLSVVGKGSIFGLRLISPLHSSRPNFYHSFTVGADYKDFKQNVLLQGADAVASPVQYPPLTAAYSASWYGATGDPHHAGAAVTAERSSTTLDLGATFIIRALGGVDAQQFSAKRSGADSSFIVLHTGLRRQQLLAGNWSLVGRFDSQLASGPLISSEEYGAGGVDSVRGYVESERLGDDGIRGSLELRTPQLFGSKHSSPDQSYFFLFADAARLRILEPLPHQQDAFHLESIGLGAHFKRGGLLADVSGARALSDGYVTKSGDDSVQFTTRYAW
jgi:hemolysin activation/secretion protein